jgi:hypothetical protein
MQTASPFIAQITSEVRKDRIAGARVANQRLSGGNVSQQKPKGTVWSKYGYFWVTLALFIGSLAGHWTFGWFAFVAEQSQHSQSPEVREFVIQAMRDTLENWQSEFLQLIWQVAGLALLYHIGSPQSKDGNDRLEEKVDLILQAVSKDAKSQIAQLDRAYHRD